MSQQDLQFCMFLGFIKRFNCCLFHRTLVVLLSSHPCSLSTLPAGTIINMIWIDTYEFDFESFPIASPFQVYLIRSVSDQHVLECYLIGIQKSSEVSTCLVDGTFFESRIPAIQCLKYEEHVGQVIKFKSKPIATFFSCT
jgi:hypothetical protein